MILELCTGVHCVDLGESFQTHSFLSNLASIQPRTNPLKFAASMLMRRWCEAGVDLNKRRRLLLGLAHRPLQDLISILPRPGSPPALFAAAAALNMRDAIPVFQPQATCLRRRARTCLCKIERETDRRLLAFERLPMFLSKNNS